MGDQSFEFVSGVFPAEDGGYFSQLSLFVRQVTTFVSRPGTESLGPSMRIELLKRAMWELSGLHHDLAVHVDQLERQRLSFDELLRAIRWENWYQEQARPAETRPDWLARCTDEGFQEYPF